MTQNILIPSILLFTLFSIGCSPKQETKECDSTKFDCTPKASEVVKNEVVASEPVQPVEDETIQTADVSNSEHTDGDPDFHVSKAMPWDEQKKVINSEFKSLIKDEINTILNSNTDTWQINVLSKKDGVGDQKGFVIYKYSVTSSSPEHEFLISEKDCIAHAQISSEDNRTPMAMTLDTDCYKNLEGFF
jgi:hypothetical protein